MVITGFRRRVNERDELLLAREAPDGSLVPAGSAAFGLQVAAGNLFELLAQHQRQPRRRRSAVTWVKPAVRVAVDFHGPPHRPIRDAVIRELEPATEPALE
jgi:hypothetical protein